MKTYELHFVKRGKKGKKILRAKNLSNAQGIALSQNLQILSLKEISLQKKSRLKSEDIILFFKEFSLLLGVGLSIKEALNQLENHCTKDLKIAIYGLQTQLNLGQNLSKSFESSNFNLNSSELTLIKISEKTGDLSKIFSQMALLREKLSLNQKRFKKATHYPILVFLALMVAFLFLMFFVVPQFKDLFENLGQALPLITRILLGGYEFLNHYFAFLILAFCCGFFLHILGVKKNQNYAFMIDYFLLKIPILSRFILYHQNYYFFMIFSLLLKSGVELSMAFDLASSSVSNGFLRFKFNQIATSLEQGLELSQAFTRAKIFDELVLSLLSTAMKSAKLDFLSEEIANFYAQKQENLLEKFLVLLEPLMTLCVGILVLFLALGLFLPLWELSSGANLH